MSLQPIDPVSDSRVEHRTALLNGYTYHYLYGEPASGKFRATVFLVSSSYLLGKSAGGNYMAIHCSLWHCDERAWWLTDLPVYRFMDGRTALQVGVSRFLSCFKWD
jgi:hypothetical protein